jgi:hypothetical protein
MSFVIAAPEMVTSAASDLASIGSMIGEANAVAAAPTAGVIAAARMRYRRRSRHCFLATRRPFRR